MPRSPIPGHHSPVGNSARYQPKKIPWPPSSLLSASVVSPKISTSAPPCTFHDPKLLGHAGQRHRHQAADVNEPELFLPGRPRSSQSRSSPP